MEYPFKDLLPLDEVLEREGYYKDWTHLDPKVFYSLTQISEYIKTKGFGVDVRLLISQLAEHFGLKTTQVVDLANLLQQNFENLEGVTQSFTNNINSLVAQMEADKDAVIANATVDSEVILARGGKPTLQARLDETDEQLEDIGVNIRKFGVVGDGVVDDGPAIKAAHTWANANSKKLWYPPGEYYIRDAKEIPIQHDVDASQATIIVDTDIHSTAPLYRITSKNPEVELTTGLANLTINKKTTKVPEFGGYGDAIVRVQNTNKKIYIREGANANEGVSQFDKFVVDNLGNLKNEVIWDFDTITHATIYPIDADYITVKFGKWIYNNIHEADYYVRRNINVTRSRTKLSVGEEITRPIDALAHFSGVIVTGLCYDVEIFDSLLEVKPARTNSSGVMTGTYGLQTNETISLTFRNVKSVEIPDNHYGWGIMGGSGLKDFRMIDCDLNRVDSHQGSHNLFVENSTVGSWGLTLTGSGLLHIKDTTIQGAVNVVTLRQDYGSTWEGKIKIENVEHIPKLGSDPHVILGNPTYTHDFGYTCHFGTEIEIDGYTVHDSGQDMISLLAIVTKTTTGKVNDYFLPKRIIVKNARTKAGTKKLRVFDIGDYARPRASHDGSYVREGAANHIETNIDVNIYSGDWIETVDMIGLSSLPLSSYSSGSELLTSRLPYFNITLSELDIVYLMPGAHPFKFTILNSTLKRLYAEDGGGSRGIISMVGGVVDSRNDDGDFGIRITLANARFVGVDILPPRNSNGELIETIEGISKAHDFIGWGFVANRFIVKNYFSACPLFDSYPTSIVAPDLTSFDISKHMLPSFGVHYRVSGSSSTRPISTNSPSYNPLPMGYRYFDTTLGKPIFYTGTGWVDSTGAGV